MTEVIHTSRDHTGEITSFLVLEDGEPTQKANTPENILLYEHGLHDFFSGDSVVEIADGVHIASRNEGYVLVVDGELIEIPPVRDDDFLQTVSDVIEGVSSGEELRSLHHDILSGQVRRDVVNSLIHIFGEKKYEIQRQSNGWLIEDMLLVDWNANIYAKDDDPEEGDYIRSGGTVTRTDKSYEALQLTEPSLPTEDVVINGSDIELTEQEVLFLAKVLFIIGRSKYHPDEAFWAYMGEYFDNE